MAISLKQAVLTIDDGPTKHFLRKCDYLQMHQIPAILFCIGRELEARPGMVVEAIRKGFIIANHSYTHPHFSGISLTRAYKEIEKTHVLIDQLYRAADTPRPANWFRFPYGDKGDGRYGKVFAGSRNADLTRKQAIQDCLLQLGYAQPEFPKVTYPFYHEAGLLKDIDWHWTFDVMEWNLRMQRADFGLDTAEKILARLESHQPEDSRGLQAGDKRWMGEAHSDEIILLHDHIETTELFFLVIDKLLSLPLKFVLP